MSTSGLGSNNLINWTTVACATKGIAASAVRDSNKARLKRYLNRAAPKNEDQFQVNNDVEGMFYVGVFDGHGGGGASQYLRDRLHLDISTKVQERKSKSEASQSVHGEETASALSNAFNHTDHSLFMEVTEYCGTTNFECRCNYYRENPCLCSKAPRTANEGSTATVVMISESEVVCANVGDSEAILLRSRDAGAYVLNDDESASDDEYEENNTPSSSPSADYEDSYSNAEECDDEPTAKRHKRAMSDAENLGSPLIACEFESSEGISSQASDRSVQRNRWESGALSVFNVQGNLVSCETLTAVHTPIVDENNEDYQRIRSVARSRARSGLCSAKEDGIALGVTERCNYVSLDGAHRLNMTRAFGNFGLKTVVPGAICEKKSVVLSKPSSRVIPRQSNDMCLVLGSDGLWDNLSQSKVTTICCEEVHRAYVLFLATRESREGEIREKEPADGNTLDEIEQPRVDDDDDSASEVSGDSSVKSTSKLFCGDANAMQKLSRQVAKSILKASLESRRKNDDISVVVVFFPELVSYLDSLEL